MIGRLLAIGGPVAGASLPLAGPEVSVGREAMNQVALADPAVSAQHCVFIETADGIVVRDLDPANPTFVNGLPAGERPLADGDQVQIGESLFVLVVTKAEAAAAAPVIVHVTPAPTPF